MNKNLNLAATLTGLFFITKNQYTLLKISFLQKKQGKHTSILELVCCMHYSRLPGGGLFSQPVIF